MKSSLTLSLLIFINQAVGQIELTSSNLPILIIETNGQEIIDDPKITASLKVINNSYERNIIASSDYTYDGSIGIEIRGNTSQGFPKKSFGLELRDEQGENLNYPLLGLPSENDWILYAPYTDKTMLRNVLALELARNSGHYASRTAFCEVIINNVYQGVYVLMEKIKRDKNRVDINQLKEEENSGEDLTGGYIIKIDNPTGTYCESWSPVDANYFIQFEYPSCEVITEEQKSYIKSYVLDFENALHEFEANPADRGYLEYIDEKSIIDYFLVNELTKNVDAFMLSAFLYKNKNGKLNFGPIWDYNLSFGNAEMREGYSTMGFQSNINELPWWWNTILSDTIIQKKIKSRWCELRSTVYSHDSIFELIDSYTLQNDEAQKRNFEKWPVQGVYIWPNYYLGETYADEVLYFKNWINARLTWLDNELDCPSYAENEVSVYPNPFSNSFNCKIKLTESKNVSAYLYDLNGKKVQDVLEESNLTSSYWSFTWNGNHLKSGVYYLRIDLDQDPFQSVKIVKL